MKHCPNPDCPHLADTRRAGEYRDEAVTCSDCGRDLVPGEPPEIEQPGRLQWTTVLIVPDPHAAHLARAALAMEGIPSELRRTAKATDSLVAGTPSSAEVIVPDHFADAAKEALEARSAAPVELPDDEDLEFIDADGRRIEWESTEDDPASGYGETASMPAGNRPAHELSPSSAATERESSAWSGDPAASPSASDPSARELSAGAAAAAAQQSMDSYAGAAGTTESEWPPCPRCDSSSITHSPPPSDAESRGLLKRLFSAKRRWLCLACDHRW